MEIRHPLPPFTRETAIQKVRLAEDGWNTRDAAKVALAYTQDTKWRNRAEFANNRQEAQALLERKWRKELDYRLIKELWVFESHRIAVRYAYVSHPGRSYGRLWNKCGCSLYQFFMACMGVLLLSADWGSWWLYKAT